MNVLFGDDELLLCVKPITGLRVGNGSLVLAVQEEETLDVLGVLNTDKACSMGEVLNGRPMEDDDELVKLLFLEHALLDIVENHHAWRNALLTLFLHLVVHFVDHAESERSKAQERVRGIATYCKVGQRIHRDPTTRLHFHSPLMIVVVVGLNQPDALLSLREERKSKGLIHSLHEAVIFEGGGVITFREEMLNAMAGTTELLLWVAGDLRIDPAIFIRLHVSVVLLKLLMTQLTQSSADQLACLLQMLLDADQFVSPFLQCLLCIADDVASLRLGEALEAVLDVDLTIRVLPREIEDQVQMTPPVWSMLAIFLSLFFKIFCNLCRSARRLPLSAYNQSGFER